MQEVASLRHYRHAKESNNSGKNGKLSFRSNRASAAVFLEHIKPSPALCARTACEINASQIENPLLKFRYAGLSCTWARPARRQLAAEARHSQVSQPRVSRGMGFLEVPGHVPGSSTGSPPKDDRPRIHNENLCQGPGSENGSLQGTRREPLLSAESRSDSPLHPASIVFAELATLHSSLRGLGVAVLAWREFRPKLSW